MLLGLPAGHAARLADRALSRARRTWRTLGEEAEPDLALLGLFLEERCAAIATGEPWWQDAEGPAPPALGDLSVRLDRLGVTDRAVLAWTALGRVQIDPGVDPTLLAQVVAAVPGLPVPPPTGAVSRHRGRRWRRTVLVVAGAGAATAGVLALLPGPPDPEPPLGPLTVTPARNPAPVAWYADGRVHLVRGTAEVDGVVALVQLREQVVYLDDRGRVVRLDADGARTELGRADPAAGLTVSEPAGRVAWLAEDGSSLEVADVPGAEVVARLDVAGAARMVRFPAPVLVFADDDGEHEWHTVTGSVRAVLGEPGDGPLLDVVGVTQLRQDGEETITVRQLLGTPVVRLGEGGKISPRQQFVWTRSGDDGSGVRVFAVGSGEELASGTDRADVVLDARFTGADRITYLLADRAALPGPAEAGRVSSTGTLEVRTCQVRNARCTVHAVGAGAGDATALLAR